MMDATFDEQEPDTGYYCGSCDALLGSDPRPCPRCDGVGYDPDGSYEADLALDTAQFPYHYGMEGPCDDSMCPRCAPVPVEDGDTPFPD